jgi:predicted oxidoreductase
VEDAGRLVHAAYDNGITLYDHAELYGFGRCEEVFGEILTRSPGLRDKIVLQSKCGQVFPEDWKAGDPIRIDLGLGHIVAAAEGSLQRLRTDRLDILLLHVADSLVEPEEVAKAFDQLKSSGKVRYFGVSNYTAAEIELLKKSVREPLVANQVQVGLGYPNLIMDGMDFSLHLAAVSKRPFPPAQVTEPGTFDYCRLHDIQIQAYSPVRGDLLKPPEKSSAQLRRLVQAVAALAEEKKVKPPAIALAWLLRHPAGIVPILGTHNVTHLSEDCAADNVELSHEEWYHLSALAAGIESPAEG